MKTLSQLLNEKGHQIFHIHPDASVFEAIQQMADKGIGALLVLDDQHQLVGILSERDYARKVILKGRSSKETPVRDIMTREVICASPRQTVEEAMALMTEKRIRHLPVMDKDHRLLGIVSIGDLVKSIIEEQRFIIEQLEHYIHQGT